MQDQVINKGTKFFKYNEDSEPEVIRVRYVDKVRDKVKYTDSNNEKKYMSFKEFKENYRMLRPDGIVNIITAKVDNVTDVIVTVAKLDNSNRDIPFAVCRQYIYDVFSNMTNNKIYSNPIIGVSISEKTCPANVNFRDVLSCTGMKDFITLSVYLDDTLDDIIGLANQSKYNSILRTSAEYTSINLLRPNTTGLCYTLRELLENNNFIYDFRQCFDVVEVPYHIDPNSDMLSMDNLLYIEDMIKQNIMATYVIKYSKEIDLREIRREYMLVSSSADKYQDVYIVGYDTSDNDYVKRH